MTNTSTGVARPEHEPQSIPSPVPADDLTYLDPQLVALDIDVASRKRLFEEFSTMISGNSCNDQTPDPEDIFDTLHDRERLGCTALGKGIALPHGRLEGISKPIVAMARLKSAIDFDAPDAEPVWFAVCLLVPVDANEIHLNLLARLASKFSDDKFVQKIKDSESSEDLYKLFSDI